MSHSQSVKKLFGLAESPEQYFVSEGEKKDLSLLLESCKSGYPVNVIKGESGCGLTATAFYIFQSVPYETHEILYISQLSESDKNGLIHSLLSLFGVESTEDLSPYQSLKRCIMEVEEIQKEGRKLLVIIDSVSKLSSQFWNEQVEPLLAINNINSHSFSFLITMNQKSFDELSENPSFFPEVCLKKSKLKRGELESYLKSRLRGTELESIMLDEEELNRIFKLSKGILGRINELSAVAFARISRHKSIHIAENEKTPEVSTGIKIPKPLPEPKKSVVSENSITKSAIVPPPIPPQFKQEDKGEVELNPEPSIDTSLPALYDDSWDIIKSLLKSS